MGERDSLSWLSRAPAATERLGRLLGAQLQGGDCVALIGELGAGKTAFARGVGQGLGVVAAVRSPSYLLCCDYPGRLPLLHLDAYFSARLEALLADGLASRFTAASVVLVEWADRLENWWPPDRLEIRIEPGAAEEERLLRARARGLRAAALLQAWQAADAAAAAKGDAAGEPPGAGTR